MKRRPTEAMYRADETRIAKAQAIVDQAFNAALIGCPYDMGCGDWMREHAAPHLVEAYAFACKARDMAEQAAVDRGTMYRGAFGRLYKVDWRR